MERAAAPSTESRESFQRGAEVAGSTLLLAP
jgi:hypothetical protein